MTTQYLQLLRDIKQHGVFKGDRTGTGTQSLFGAQSRYDLREGFPLITTKLMFTRGMIHELLWFLRGDTNIKYLNDNKVHFWDAWADENGDLGPVYGHQLRRIRSVRKVDPMIFEPEPLILPVFDKTIDVDYSRQETSWLGREMETLGGNRFTVIKELPPIDGGRTRFVVKFHDTGTEVETSYSNVQARTIKDPWAITVFGVGCHGDYDRDDSHALMLMNVWREMLRRCYNEDCKIYEAYGGRGVHVDPDWLVFENFQTQIKELPNWYLKIDYPDDYSLDKDILYASNRYSLGTCVWASHEEQGLNTSTNRPFSAISPEGDKTRFFSAGEAWRQFDLNISAVHRCLNGGLKTHHGWSEFEYLGEAVYRVRIFDQLKSVISALRHNPDDRRHIITLWGTTDIDDMRLPPCHGIVIQFWTRELTLEERESLRNNMETKTLGYGVGGKDHDWYTSIGVPRRGLSCQTYQRSCDVFLGVPVNIASYALLMHMVAQCVDMVALDLVYCFGDVHIYNNHREQVDLQLTREPKPLPRLWLNPEIKDIDGFGIDDIRVLDYEHWPKIRASVSV